MVRLASIRARTIAFTLLIMIVPVILLGAFVTLYYHEVIRQNLYDDFIGNAKTVSALTSNYMDRAVQFLERQSERAPLINSTESGNAAVLYDQAEKINDATELYYWVFVTDKAGNVLASQPYGQFTGQYMGGNPFVAGAATTGKTCVGSPVMSEISGKPTIFVATPIIYNGSTVGVLVGALDDDYYFNVLAGAMAIVPYGNTCIINETGFVIIHNNRKFMNTVKDVSGIPAVQHVLRGEEGIEEYDNPVEGGRWLGAYARVPGYGWSVVRSLPVNVAYRPVNDATGIFLVALAFLSLLATGLAIVAGNYILNPIARISAAIDKVAERGNFSKVDPGPYLPYDRADEMGNLARSFKNMSDRITAAGGEITGDKKRANFYIDVMGHDINNLNQVILSNLELLQHSGRLADALTRFLDGAILATKDSANIVKNVKAMQKIYAESREAADIDLDDLIRECIGEVPERADKKTAIRYAPRKGRMVKAMPELKLAFCNVIGNSIKYSGDTVHIDIGVEEAPVDGKKCYVTAIEDDGHGIPENVRETLIEGFRHDATVPPGKGLGLYTARALAEASGGTLKVEGRVPGDYTKGTRVIITLPASEET